MPILAFMVGVMITEIVKLNFRYSTKIHWRQIVIALEILVLLAVSFVRKAFAMIWSIRQFLSSARCR
ncbi:MAG: DUF1275 family protein [Lachnospiraceae bacterium]